MSRVTLYHSTHGTDDNAVHVVMTEDAFTAWAERQRHIRRHGSADQDTTITHRIVIGTMTFVSAGRLINPEEVRRHYGTFEVMEALFKRCTVVEIKGLDGPFHNGDAISSDELARGYGYNGKRWVRLLAEVRKAYLAEINLQH